MKTMAFRKMLDFLDRLAESRISYSLRHSRDDALMVVAYAPGEYWEIEFLEDGNVEIERYRSNGEIEDETALEEFFALWSDEEPPSEPPMKADEVEARK